MNFIGNPTPIYYACPHRLHYTGKFWSTSCVKHPVTGVWTAHYVRDKFLIPTIRWRDEECTIPIDQYRYQKELVVMKCRNGEEDKQRDDSNWENSGTAWTAHRYLAFRVDTSPAEYAKMLAPCILNTPEMFDGDYEGGN